MARERSTTIRCAEAGCGETKLHLYTSRRQYDEIWADQNKRPWKCSRHERPEEVLRPDNPTTTYVLVASRVRFSGYEDAVARRSPYARRPEEFLDGLFWLPEGAGRGGSGFSFGPGFKAHASDFPEGTRLVVTTRIELPEVSDAASA